MNHDETHKGAMCTPVEYMYFPNALFATIFTSLALTFMYCKHKFIVAKESHWTHHIAREQKILLMYFVKEMALNIHFINTKFLCRSLHYCVGINAELIYRA
jgi:hypothetical protein